MMKYVIQKDLFGQFFILMTNAPFKKSDTFDSEALARNEVHRRILDQIKRLQRNLEHVPVEGDLTPRDPTLYPKLRSIE